MVSKTFLNPIKLEFEKVYAPLLLITKKRYAGLKYLDPDKAPKMDTTGVETNRRDNCQFVRDTMTVTLDMIMKEQKVKEAEDYVKFRVSQLLQDKLDLSQLIITKGYVSRWLPCWRFPVHRVCGMLRRKHVGHCCRQRRRRSMTTSRRTSSSQ